MSDLISRQDAIEAVWELDKDANEYVVDDAKEIHGYCTAIGVCVGALSALPSADAEGDLISRQCLIELYGDYIGDDGESKYHVPLEIVRQNIKDAPSAEPKTGEWEFDTVIPIGGGAYSAGYRCSNCGSNYFKVEGMNFCPNCGARMNGGEEE